MPWTPLRNRLHQLPLILAGPILRRTEANSVTVWLALQQPCQVTLQIQLAQNGELGEVLLGGQRATVAVGQHLHLVAVTAQSTAQSMAQPTAQRSASGSVGLQPGQLYAYNLVFRTADGQLLSLHQALNTEHRPPVSISYFDHGLPTFLLPPQDINELKIAHGSCRKTHGGGIDALAILDDLIEQSAAQVQQRPHQVFFTGDQIYGDDVADPWLFALTDAGDTLLGWEEELPIAGEPNPAIPALKPKHLPPGERSNEAEQLAGFTAGLPNKPDHVNSHLLGLGEYCAAYLFAWSPMLWPRAEEFPSGRERYRDPKQIQTWDRETQALKNFFQPLWKVRRALANIPTYMVFDDHDVSDDWYLNRAWCERVLGKPLGRRVVQNALLAYALCQAWGNTPEQFAAGEAGSALLQAAEVWSASRGTAPRAAALIGRLVGLPDTDASGLPRLRRDETVWILDHHPSALRWHYTLRSACHEVVVLDSRTWRGYPMGEDPMAPPMLLSPSAFDQQIRQPLQQKADSSPVTTLVIAPTNLIHLRIIDWVQELSLQRGQVFNYDVGDAWNLHKEALAELLAALFESRDRVIVLSGDIHYGFAARLSYWTRPPLVGSSGAEDAAGETVFTQKSRAQVLIQLTSSAFKNAELKTQIIQTKLKSLVPEPPQEWVGWHHTPELWELQTTAAGVRWLKLPPVTQLPLIRQLTPARGNDEITWTIGAREPDSLPDWHYRIEWIRRQAACPPAWSRSPWLRLIHRPPHGLGRLGHRLSWFWRNRWLQEGEEVVGESNIGLVQFRAFESAADARANRPDVSLQNTSPKAPKPIVFQDLYWCPPWRPDQIVRTRFEGELYPEAEAVPFPLLSKRSSYRSGGSNRESSRINKPD
ncbi:MAG: PhoD-like phosphatase [Elainella sp.]